MFRRLKTVYFLSTKNYLLYKRQEKPLHIIRLLSTLKTSPNLVGVLHLVIGDTKPDWPKILEKVGLKHPYGDWEVIRFCGKNRLGRQLLSFLEYLTVCDRLNRHTIMVFLDVVELEKYFEPCYPIVYHLFVKYIGVDVTIVKRCALILVKSPLYSDKVMKICTENHTSIGVDIKLLAALNSCSKPEESLPLLLRQVGKHNAFLVDSILKLLNSEAQSDASGLIIDLIKELSTTKTAKHFYNTLKNIMILANKKDMGYKWKMRGSVCMSDKCKFCMKNLGTCDMTQHEIDLLLTEFENNIISKYLSLPSTASEWRKYVEFLDHHNYDVVVDGLNLVHVFRPRFDKGLDNRLDGYWNTLNFLNSCNLKPLIINKHGVRGITDVENPFLMYKLRNEVYDDFYIMYAALRRGKGCILISHDKYGFFNNVLHATSSRDLFQKWKETHFAKVRPEGIVTWPIGVRLGLHEEHCLDRSEFKCHVVVPSHDYYGYTFCIARSKIPE